MDNQHRKITGYRDLSQVEVDLMNRIKAHGAELDRLVKDVRGHLAEQEAAAPTGDEVDRIRSAEPARWAAMAKTHFQEGLMALTRAVAQPGSF